MLSQKYRNQSCNASYNSNHAQDKDKANETLLKDVTTFIWQGIEKRWMNILIRNSSTPNTFLINMEKQHSCYISESFLATNVKVPLVKECKKVSHKTSKLRFCKQMREYSIQILHITILI